MKMLESKLLADTPVFKVTFDRALDPEGHEIGRAIVHHQGSAVVMALDAKKRTLLVRQYRLPAKAYLWELVAGRIDPGETALKAAKRELIEESGLRAKKWKKLLSIFVSPGFLDEKMDIYLATDLAQGEREVIEDERIEMRWFTVKEMEKAIRKGKIVDAKTIAGFLAWRHL